MKLSLFFRLAWLFGPPLLWSGGASANDSVRAPGDFHVATDGRDDWSGRLAQPNTARTDGPFATLARARDAARALIASGERRDLTVLIHGGVYALKETVVFGLADSAPEGHTVTYAAAPGETPVFCADAPIRGWRRLEQAPAGLPANARGKVWAADVPETQGGAWRFYALYDGGRRLPRARSQGFAPANDVAANAAANATDDDAAAIAGEGESRSTLRFSPGALRNWDNLEDVEIVIRPHWNWVLNILPLASVDERAGVARTTIPGTYPLDKVRHERDNSQSCWVENVLEALDEPGEWVLDTRAGRLYLWPLGDEPGEGIVAPRLRELLRVEGKIDTDAPTDTPARGIVFRGLTFTRGDRDTWSATDAGLQHDWEIYDKDNGLVRLRGAERCAVEECQFVDSGGTAIRLDLTCRDNRIEGNTIARMGGSGIVLCGYGPGTKDASQRNAIVNNHIHDCGELYWHNPGIMIWQSGNNRVANNLIHHLPYNGLVISGAHASFFDKPDQRELTRTVRWGEVGGRRQPPYAQWLKFAHSRDNLVERNEFHHVMERLGDGNAVYVRMAGEGNRVCRNYIHDLVGGSGQSALRTDGGQRGTWFAENIVARCVVSAVTLKLNNHAENNYFIDVLETNDPRNPTKNPLAGYIRLREGPMTGATIKRNIFYSSGGATKFYDEDAENPRRGRAPGKLTDVDVDGNLYYCAGDPAAAEKTLAELKRQGLERNGATANPGFVDAASGDYRLRPDSPALKLGIQPIDVGEIGLLPGRP